MKKILLFISLFCFLNSFGQYPNNPSPSSNDSTLSQIKGAVKSVFINKVFLDTAAANLQRIKWYNGAQIVTTSGGNKFYIRDSALNKWNETSGSGFTSANNGAIASSSTNIQLGQTIGAVGDPAILTHNTEIPLGGIFTGFQFGVSSDFSAYASLYPIAKSYWSNAARLWMEGADGANTNYVTLDSTASSFSSFPGEYHYSGYNHTLQSFSGLHWTSTDKHYDIVDLRGSLTYTDVQVGGQSTTDWRNTGETYLGLIGSHRVGVNRGLATLSATFDVQGTMKVSDSVSLFSRILQNTDSIYGKRSDGTLGAIAQSSIVGAVPTWDATLAVSGGSTLTTNRTIAGGGFDFTMNNMLFRVNGVGSNGYFYVDDGGNNQSRLGWTDASNVNTLTVDASGISSGASNTGGTLTGSIDVSKDSIILGQTNAAYRFKSVSNIAADTTTNKLAVLTSNGLLKKMYWPAFGTGTVTSVAAGVGMTFTTITTTGTVNADSTKLLYKTVGTNITGAMQFLNNQTITIATGSALTITGATGSSTNIALTVTGRAGFNGVTSPQGDIDVGNGSILTGSIIVTTAAGTNQTGNFSTGAQGLVGSNVGAIYQVLSSSTVNAHVYGGGTGATAVGVGLPGATMILGSSALVEAASGTHPLFAGLIIRAPTVTAAAAAVTTGATLYIDAATAPVGATAYSVWVDAGLSRFDGGLDLNGTSAPLQLNTSAGTSGFLLTSAGAGATPTWTDPASLSGLPYIASSGSTAAGGNIAITTSSNTFDIDGQGIISIGDVSVAGSGTKLMVEDNTKLISLVTPGGGGIQFSSFGAGAWTLDASGNGSSVSDGRLKYILRPYTAGLKELMKFNPIVYKWRPESKMETEHEYAGLDAREVHSILGDLGTGINKQGYYSIQDRALISMLITSVQELKTQFDDYKKSHP